MVPFDLHCEVALGLNACFEMGALSLYNLIRSLQRAQEARCLGYLDFFLYLCGSILIVTISFTISGAVLFSRNYYHYLTRVAARVFERLNLLQSARMLTVVYHVVLADNAHLRGSVCLTSPIVGTASVHTDVVDRHVLDRQCYVTEVEEGCDS